MTIASIQSLKMEFGDKLLFDNITFGVNEGDFIGLIGANGCGKTTLFKLLTGEYEPTGGGVFLSKNLRVGYLEQHACQNSERNVYDEILTVFAPLISQEEEIKRISQFLEQNPDDSAELITRLNDLTEAFQNNGGLTYLSRAGACLMGLGFSENDFTLPVKALSGGQRSKLSMGKLLLSRPDLLLLDEPTNHLDIAGTEWLEDFLLSFKGSAIIISHDRYFLDKVTNKTLEISNRGCHCNKGNYSVYQKIKEERLESERRHYQSQLEEIKRIEGIIEQQRSFARERNFITAESKRKMLEKKRAELIEPEMPVSEMKLSFTIESESGNDVLFIKNLKKSFPGNLLFENGELEVYKKDRAFIIGKNGCGKTTLLKILNKQIFADSGSFTFGSNVKIGYFDQNLSSLRGNKTVLDEIWDEHRLFTETQVRKYLSFFLFKGDDVFKNVNALSGGEKAKLCLLKLMLSGANVLLLDEPTNHLDITSREILENALLGFEGTIIAVSHDRYFINKLATKIFTVKESGFEFFEGNYDDYCLAALSTENKKSEKKSEKVNDYKLKKERESRINKLRGKIKRDEERIDQIENEISSLNNELSKPDTAASYERVLTLTEKIEELTNEQAKLMEEWEREENELNELI